MVAPEPWLQPSMSTAALVVRVDMRRAGWAELPEGREPGTSALEFAFHRADLLRVPLVALRCVFVTPRRALSDAARLARLTLLGGHTGDPLRGTQLGFTVRTFLHQAQRPVALVPVTTVGQPCRVERDDARL